MHQTKDGVVLGQDENGAPIRAPEFIQSALKCKLSIPTGLAVAAKDVQTTSKSSQSRILILATARVADADTGGGK